MSARTYVRERWAAEALHPLVLGRPRPVGQVTGPVIGEVPLCEGAKVKRAYRVLIIGEPSYDYPTAREALRFATSKVYTKMTREEALAHLRQHGKVAWTYGFASAEVKSIPYYDSRM